MNSIKFNSLFLFSGHIQTPRERHTRQEDEMRFGRQKGDEKKGKILIKRSVCVIPSRCLSHLARTSSQSSVRPQSYQQAMNNEKKLDSNPSVKFVFNGDTLGVIHICKAME